MRSGRTSFLPVFCQFAKIVEKLPAEFRTNGFGMELHSPLGKRSVTDAHNEVVFASRNHFQRIGYGPNRQGVVTNSGERRRNVFEEVGSAVKNGRQATVPGIGSQVYQPSMKMANALMAKTDTENGDVGLCNDAAADTEVGGIFRATWPGRNDDVVKSLDQVRRPAGIVVRDDERRTTVDGSN